MKIRIKNVSIGIKSLEQGAKELVEAVEAYQRGRPYRKPEADIHFESLEVLLQVLTPKRFELLRLIRKSEPESIYQLARAAGRDLKNVQNDVALLARMDLIEISRSNARRKRVIPRVGYDRLQLQIPMS